MPLFIDFLHDHGHSELRVRVRVMPSCFLVLLEHTLTVQASARNHHTARRGTCCASAIIVARAPHPLGLSTAGRALATAGSALLPQIW